MINRPKDERGISSNYQMKCTEHFKIGPNEYEYNRGSELFFLSFLLVIGGILIGELQGYAGINLNGEAPFDLWSIAHILTSAGVYCIILLLSRRTDISLILSIAFTFGWELIEYWIQGINLFHDFAYESIWNRLADLVVDALGILVIYLYTIHKKSC